MSQTSTTSALSEIVQYLVNIGLTKDQMIFTLCQIFGLGLTYRKRKIYEIILITLIRISNTEKDLLINLAKIGFDINFCCIKYIGETIAITIPIRNHNGRVIAVSGSGKFSSL